MIDLTTFAPKFSNSGMRTSIPALFGLIFILASFSSVAQKGIIRGTVIEDATGEALFGVTVVIAGTTTGSVTDFDGAFEIKADPGTYDIQVSFVSFQTITVTDVSVSGGETTVLDQIRLKESVEELEAVVVTSEILRDSETALLTIKKKSANLMDGISAASFRKIGDSDAADAVKRVTGVSVEGGKYVYVRGLGDRYTKTMLNSSDIPGLDPDRNSLQIDIFPTNLIDNMVVLKTALASMPADFTGGVVNIDTKAFPDERIFNVSVGINYNPSMHFQNDFISYDGSRTDWLGFDTDLRSLPTGARGDIPRPNNGTDQEVNDFVSSFSPALGVLNETSFLDYSAGISLGNQYALANGSKLGYIFSTTYKRSTIFYDDAFYGEFQRPNAQSDNNELIAANLQDGALGSINTLIGGLGGIAYKTRNSKFRLTALHLQNGELRAGQFRIVADPEDGRDAVGKSDYVAENSNNLEYGQRGLTNFMLNGTHHSGDLDNDKGWEIDWRISPTFSNLEDPDIRKAAFTTNFGTPELDAGAAGFPTRIWRYLDEFDIVGRIDITKNGGLLGRDSRYKFGSSVVYKDRDYEILQYNLAIFQSLPNWPSTDPNIILQDQYIYPNFNGGGVYYNSANPVPNPNEYNSTSRNLAFYGSAEFSPAERLKAIIGLRSEWFYQEHTGRDQTAATTIQFAMNQGVTNIDSVITAIQAETSGNLGYVLDGDEVLDAIDFFPSLNLIYSLTDQQNLRLSYSRTIARPSFKELSFAQILDPVSDRIFNGGLFPYQTQTDSWDGRLTETRIDNFDIRWELFMNAGQIFSVSAFYKKFDDPIEIVRIPSAQTSNEFQPRNVGDGQVYGAELEVRKSLNFISPSLTNFLVTTNITLVKSSLDMTEVEFTARKRFERPGQTIENTRVMAGQSPVVINAGLAYDNPDAQFDAGFFYNVQGETLTFVGGGLFPDVYSVPFHSLNFNMNKSFGTFSLNLSVSNILNDKREQNYKGFNAEDQTFTAWSPGTSFGVGIDYSF